MNLTLAEKLVARAAGAGSFREQAVEALRHLGIMALVAQSFAGLFYRNALNQVNVFDGTVENLTTGNRLACEPIPAHLAPMVRDGGLLAHLEKRLRKGASDGSRPQG